MIAEAPETEQPCDNGLEVRLAHTPGEIEAAQRLRYQVFYEEMGAKPSPDMAAEKRDFDSFDAVCDHLLVLDKRRDSAVVGTYRLQRRENNPGFSRFYTAAEYDTTPIDAFPGRVLELGRSCVDAAYRNKMTMQILWRGLAGYVFAHDIDLMFGCASLPGTDPDALAASLSYLHHHHLAPEALRPRALPERYVAMDRMPADRLDAKRALASLPPLVKGYLRLGGFVGDGAVIDHQFNTTDVCVIVKTELVTEKYYRHYDRTATRSL